MCGADAYQILRRTYSTRKDLPGGREAQMRHRAQSTQIYTRGGLFAFLSCLHAPASECTFGKPLTSLIGLQNTRSATSIVHPSRALPPLFFLLLISQAPSDGQPQLQDPGAGAHRAPHAAALHAVHQGRVCGGGLVRGLLVQVSICELCLLHDPRGVACHFLVVLLILCSNSVKGIFPSWAQMWILSRCTGKNIIWDKLLLTCQVLNGLHDLRLREVTGLSLNPNVTERKVSSSPAKYSLTVDDSQTSGKSSRHLANPPGLDLHSISSHFKNSGV